MIDIDGPDRTDLTALTALVDELVADGFDHEMVATADGYVECGHCRQRADPCDVVVHRVRRIDAATGGSAVVFGALCPVCGSPSSIVVGPPSRAILGSIGRGRDLLDTG